LAFIILNSDSRPTNIILSANSRKRRYNPESHFTFGDVPKNNPQYQLVREVVYHNLLRKLRANPDLLGKTNKYWLNIAQTMPDDFYNENRLIFDAFESGDRKQLINTITMDLNNGRDK